MVKQRILDVLAAANGPLTSVSISNISGIAAPTVRVALFKLHAKEKILRDRIENDTKKGPSSIYTYRLPDAQA